MRPSLTLNSWLAVLSLFLSITGTLAVRAQEPRPSEVLKSRGISRQRGSTSSWVLVDEAAVLKNYRAAKGLATRLTVTQHQVQAMEMGDQDPRALIESCRAQISEGDHRIAAIDQELANLGPSVGIRAADYAHNLLVEERNAIVREQHRLGMMIRNLAEQRDQLRDQKGQFRGEVARLREAYMQAIDELRESVKKILKEYAELGEDEAIRRALADLSTSSRSQQKLRPSKDLQSAVKWLERAEGSVRSDTIPLHREGGVDHIDALLNGKGPVRMVFDTGAGPTTIPARLASDLGLKPTGRTVQCEVADGSRVMAKVMIIPTITVGRLTIKNVVCAVMPKEKGDVPPLLGQSFLRHFDYKYVQGTGRLVLTKAEPDEPGVRPGPPTRGGRGEPGRSSTLPGRGKSSRRRGGP